MPQYKYSRDDYYRLTNAPCLDVAKALGMEINERESDRKSWKIKGEQGLCIYRDGNNWYRFSDGKHGFPVDLVEDRLGCSREQALDFIARYVVNGVSEQVNIPRRTALSEPEKPREFSPPEHDISPRRVMAYLIKTRGIDPEIVKAMIQQKMIAEDSVHHNCLFFGRDENGVIRSCALRGSTDVKFRGEAPGGDKSCTFAMAGNNDVLRLFESPIDAMSHATFTRLLGKDWTADHRLSVNGSGNYESIKRYLTNHTEIKSVWFCYDSDQAGHDGAEASSVRIFEDFPDRELSVMSCSPVKTRTGTKRSSFSEFWRATASRFVNFLLPRNSGVFLPRTANRTNLNVNCKHKRGIETAYFYFYCDIVSHLQAFFFGNFHSVLCTAGIE